MLFGDTRIMATLKEHEKLCEIRYQQVETRLTHLEEKIDEIQHKIDSFQTFLLGLAIKSGVGIFATICGAVFVIKL
jgi:hypothetical protein